MEETQPIAGPSSSVPGGGGGGISRDVESVAISIPEEDPSSMQLDVDVEEPSFADIGPHSNDEDGTLPRSMSVTSMRPKKVREEEKTQMDDEIGESSLFPPCLFGIKTIGADFSSSFAFVRTPNPNSTHPPSIATTNLRSTSPSRCSVSTSRRRTRPHHLLLPGIADPIAIPLPLHGRRRTTSSLHLHQEEASRGDSRSKTQRSTKS